ncbi:unnamed protein product [Closterium sp. Naga37s-1]|nr:unnamed protein product [Closterium sp. Naga37s-1]
MIQTGSSAAAADSTRARAPREFFCPLSGRVMLDPVIVASGCTYERAHILQWLRAPGPQAATCPATGAALPHAQVVPNIALKELIATWLASHAASGNTTTTTSSATSATGRSSSFSISVSRGGNSHGAGHGANSPGGRRGVSFQSPPASLEKSFTVSSPRRCPSPSLPDSPTSSAASPSPSPSSAFSPTIRPAGDAAPTRTPFPPLPFPSRATRAAIYLGIAANERAWRVWDLDEKRVVTSRDVIFDEDKFPTKEKQTPQLTVVLPAREEDEAVEVSPHVKKGAESGGGENEECDDDVEEVPPTEEATSSAPSSLPLALTRGRRTPRPNTRLTDYATVAVGESDEESAAICLATIGDDNPRTHKEALASPDAPLWKQAMERELASIKENDQQQPQLSQQQQVKTSNQVTSSEAATSQAPTEGVPEDKDSCQSKPAARAAVPAGGPRGGQTLKQASTTARQPQRLAAAAANQLQLVRSEGCLPSTHPSVSGVPCEGARGRVLAAAPAATRAAAARARAGGRGAGRGRGMGSDGGCKSHVQLSLQVGAPSPGVWSIAGASPGADGAASRAGSGANMAAQADAAASAGSSSSTPRAQGQAAAKAGEEEKGGPREEEVSGKNAEGGSKAPPKVDDTQGRCVTGSSQMVAAVEKAPGQVTARQIGGQAAVQPAALRADNKQPAGQPNGTKQLKQSQLRKVMLSSGSLQQQQQPPPPLARPTFLPPPLTCPSLPSSAPRPPPLHTRSTSISTPMSIRPPLSRDPLSPSIKYSHSLSLSLSPPDKKLSHYQAPNESSFGGKGRGVRPLVLGKAGLTANGNLQSGKGGGGGVNEEVVVVDSEPMQQGKRATVNTGRGEQGRGVGGAASVGSATILARGSSTAAATATGNGVGRLLSASTKVTPSHCTPHMLSRSLSAPLSALRAMPPNVPHLHPSCLPPSTSSDYLQNQQHHTHTYRNNQHSNPQQQPQQQQHRRSPSQVIVTSTSPGARPLRPGAPSPRSNIQASKAGRVRADEGAGSVMEQGVLSVQCRAVSGGAEGGGSGIGDRDGGEGGSVERPKGGGGGGGSQARMLRSSRSSNALLPSPTPASLLHKRCSLPARSNSLVKPLPGLLEGAGAVRKGTGAGRKEGGDGASAGGGDDNGAGMEGGGADRSSSGGGGGSSCGKVKLGEEGELEAEGEGEGEDTVGEERLVHDGAQQLVDLLLGESTTMEIKAAAVKALMMLVTEHRSGVYAAWECGAVPALLSLARGHREALRKPHTRTVQNNYEMAVDASGDVGAEAGAAAEMAADIARILTYLVGDAPSRVEDTILHGVAEAGIGILGSRVQGMDAHAMGLLNCLLRWPHGRKSIADVAGSAAALVEVVERPCVRARGAAVKVMRDLVVGGFLSPVALVGEGALPPLARITLSVGEGHSDEVIKKGVDERELVKNARALLFLLKESVWQGENDAKDDSF